MKDNYLELCIQLLEWFKDLSGFNSDEFLDYMNSNNAWEILDETSLIKGSIWAEEEDIVYLLGRYLTEDERLKIISRNNS